MTPLEKYPKLAEALGLGGLYFKREDLHPYGSHKGRSIPVMIDHYYSQGDRHFAISSSGNAALAAALYVQELNSKKQAGIDLDILVGQHVSPKKLAKLREIEKRVGSDSIRILSKERPLQALTQAVQEGKRSLRQSTDDIALVGYESLAAELAGTKSIGAVFIGTSSGTTAQALCQYFEKNKSPIQVHIVQTSACHPLADQFENYDGPQEESLADAIVDQTALRRPALIPHIKQTGGYAWVATNDDIENSLDLVAKHTAIEISTNSALSVAGAIQASYRNWEMKGDVVCLICGD